MERDLNKINDYYKDIAIQNKIAYYCRYREVTIIKHLPDKDIAVRPFKIFKPEHFRWIYNRLHLDKIFFDIYISNASVKLPALPCNLDELKNARAMLNEKWNELLTGYDYFVDIDAKTYDDEEQMIEWSKKILKELRKNMQLWKTGSGGIHIIQLGRYDPCYIKSQIMDICCLLGLPLRNPVKEENDKKYIPQNRKWVEIKDMRQVPIVEKPFVDNSIYDLRRIRRVPFSIHSKTGRPMEQIKF